MNKVLPLLGILVVFACTPKKDNVTATIAPYPKTKKVDTVDTYFGVAVKDPYRWLENDTAKATAEWVSAENDVTFGYLSKIPFRDAVRKRLGEIQNYERLGAPHQEGNYYYYWKNSGLQNHNVQYRRKGMDGAEEVFLDPNSFSKDGTTSLAGMSFSKDGSLVALQIQEGGSDWRKAVVLKATDKSRVGDTLKNLKFTGIAWRGNSGFYYSSYDKPKGSELSAKTQYHKIYFHKLGTPQSKDELIFGGEATPRRYAGAGLTEDERYLIISASVSTTGNELYIQDLKNPRGKLIPVVSNFEHSHGIIDNDGSTLIIQTDLDAPNNRIVRVDASNPVPQNWKEIVPESDMAIRGVSSAGKKIFVNYLKDASTLVKQFDYKGTAEREVELPGIGSAFGFGGRVSESVVYYTYTSFTVPPTVYSYDIPSGKSTVYAAPKVDFDPSAYETKQVFFKSKDSTRVPMFIVHKKGLELNAKNPTWLYAYGGFGLSQTPGFSTSRVVWLENGCVFALPNLRGGGEYGEKWHDAGRLMNKQNVFDDFIAAAEYLIAQKYTSPDYLAVSGGSNGGLLVGATMTQRPDLMKVALPAVGVMDMLRYHKFTAGAGWAYDYGTSEDSKEMFDYLHNYSPVHALKPGTIYPATLITTADHDDRVVPAHSFKFAATLQADNVGTNPVLIRIDTKSGHGSSNLSKALDVAADQYAFTWYTMGVIPPMVKKDM